jgi:hypothetical protein
MSDAANDFAKILIKQLEAKDARIAELEADKELLQSKVMELSNGAKLAPNVTQALSALQAVENKQELSKDTQNKVRDVAKLIIRYAEVTNFK